MNTLMEVEAGFAPAYLVLQTSALLLGHTTMVETVGIKPTTRCLQGTFALLEHAPPWEWRYRDSNPGPFVCHTNALPTAPYPHW